MAAAIGPRYLSAMELIVASSAHEVRCEAIFLKDLLCLEVFNRCRGEVDVHNKDVH